MAAHIQTGHTIDVPAVGAGWLQKLTDMILSARLADMKARGNVLTIGLSDAELRRRNIIDLGRNA